MNTILNKIQPVFLSLLIAVITASLVTLVALAAGPFTRTDAFVTKEIGPQTIQSACSGTCKKLTQPGPLEANTLYKWDMGGVSNIYDWCAYIPSAGQAAVKYFVYENSMGHNWSILLNQGNAANHAKFVYLGFSDFPSQGDTTKFVELPNACQSGFSCSGLPVYFDDIRYTTYPTTMNHSTCS